MRNKIYLVDIENRKYDISIFKQFDNNVEYKIHLVENGKDFDLTGYTVTVFFENSKKESFEKSCIIDGSIITTILDNNILNQDGDLKIEFVLFKNNSIQAIFTLRANVEKSIDRNNAVTKQPQWDIIQELIDIRNENFQPAIDKLTFEINKKMQEYENRFEDIITNPTQTPEITDARDGESSLNARLKRDNNLAETTYQKKTDQSLSTISKEIVGAINELKKGVDSKSNSDHNHDKSYASKSSEHTHANKTIIDNITQTKITEWNNKATTQYVDDSVSTLNTVMKEVEGTYISTETTDGEIQDLIIEGNTFQDSSDLSIIKSSGELQENGTYKLSFLCRGKNLFDGELEPGAYDHETGKPVDTANELRSKKPSKVNGNCDYYIKTDSTTPNIRYYVYDISNNFIFTDVLFANHGVLNIPANGTYVHFRIVDTNLNVNVQLEVGTQATQYEQYQEHIQDIYLPCDLSRVGNVADRLICKDGVWGVEKNTRTVVLRGNEDFKSSIGATDFYACTLNIEDRVQLSLVISDMFGIDSATALPKEYIYCGKGVYFSVPTSKANNLNEFKEWVSKNNVLIKYITTNPQFIPLSDDQQVKLKTFMNHTNIVSLNEIPPVIKGKVPNSLKDTVSSNVKSIDRMDKQLQNTVSELVETTGYEYKSENNYINIKNSKAGTLDNVRVEGNTLVNLCGKSYDGSNGNYKIDFYYDLSEFTILCPIDDVFMNVRNSDGTWDGVLVQVKNGISYVKMDNGKKVRGFQIANTSPNLDKFKQGCILTLEGDHTQNPLQHFEGIKSVGELEELEITSCNGNLFDGQFEKGAFSNSTGMPVETPTKPNAHRSVNFINVIPNSQYAYNKIDFGRIYFYKKDGGYISTLTNSELPNMVFTTPNDCYKVKFHFESLVNEVMISKGTQPKEFIPHKSDKKKLLYKDVDGTWKPVVLREWDYIEELSDGRYKWHRKSEGKVFNGSELWDIAGRQFDNCMCFFLTSIENNKNIKGGSFISDKFAYDKMAYSENRDIECISNNSNPNDTIIVIQIAKSKLATQDVAGFKSWLQANPVTVVYQLAQEEVYDCIDLSLNSYNGETSVFTNSSIPHRLSVTQKQGLKARVETLEQEMKFLYDNFNYALKQVLAGNTQELAYMLYPQDFTDYDNSNTDEDIPIAIPEL